MDISKFFVENNLTNIQDQVEGGRGERGQYEGQDLVPAVGSAYALVVNLLQKNQRIYKLKLAKINDGDNYTVKKTSIFASIKVPKN